MSSRLGPPPRWLRCPRKGQICAEKFIPFKVPLKEEYDDMVPEDCRFYPDMLFTVAKSWRKKIGLWIDLTKTSRYYDQDSVETSDCKYMKLACKGHGECPSEDVVQTFITVVDNFIQKNPLQLVAIHCTHGFNRTGFLIVSYLVEKLDWSVDAAIGMFGNCRPPGIYKGDYIKELFNRYGDPEDALEAPPLPDWSFEDSEIEDRDEGTSQIQSELSEIKGDAKKPFIPDYDITGISIVKQPQICRQVTGKAQEWIEYKNNKFPGAQPVSMTRENIKFLSQKRYMVSWKADGTRYMMVILGPDQVFMVDRDNAVFRISNLKFPKRKDLNLHLSDVLLDGEVVLDEVNGQKYPRYLIYDIIRFGENQVGKVEFRTRLLCIEKEIIGPRNAAVQKGLIDKGREPFSIRIKPFYDIEKSGPLLDDEGTFLAQVAHETDGLIFQPADKTDVYKPGRCDDILKWKPPELNSIDFKLRISRTKPGLGMLPVVKALLYVNGEEKPFSEMPFKRDLKELDNKIVECKFDFKNKHWAFMRERRDKSFPNHISTARAVCMSIQHPVTKEMLLQIIDKIKHGSLKRGMDRESMPPPRPPKISR